MFVKAYLPNLYEIFVRIMILIEFVERERTEQ